MLKCAVILSLICSVYNKFKVESRAGTKRKLRLLVHTIILYATHNNSQPKACVIDLLGLGIICVACIYCVQTI